MDVVLSTLLSALMLCGWALLYIINNIIIISNHDHRYRRCPYACACLHHAHVFHRSTAVPRCWPRRQGIRPLRPGASQREFVGCGPTLSCALESPNPTHLWVIHMPRTKAHSAFFPFSQLQTAAPPGDRPGQPFLLKRAVSSRLAWLLRAVKLRRQSTLLRALLALGAPPRHVATGCRQPATRW